MPFKIQFCSSCSCLLCHCYIIPLLHHDLWEELGQIWVKSWCLWSSAWKVRVLERCQSFRVGWPFKTIFPIFQLSWRHWSQRSEFPFPSCLEHDNNLDTCSLLVSSQWKSSVSLWHQHNNPLSLTLTSAEPNLPSVVTSSAEQSTDIGCATLWKIKLGPSHNVQLSMGRRGRGRNPPPVAPIGQNPLKVMSNGRAGH